MNKLMFKYGSVQQSVSKACKISFLFAGVFSLAIILSDAWNLITPKVVVQRWVAVALFATITALVWYAASFNTKNQFFYQLLLLLQIIVYVLLITYVVYSQRGIASRAVALYAIPIVLSAIVKKQAMIYLTAIFCSIAYAISSIQYFYANYGQAYKAELYVELGFFCATFFVIAAISSVIAGAKR